MSRCLYSVSITFKHLKISTTVQLTCFVLRTEIVW